MNCMRKKVCVPLALRAPKPERKGEYSQGGRGGFRSARGCAGAVLSPSSAMSDARISGNRVGKQRTIRCNQRSIQSIAGARETRSGVTTVATPPPLGTKEPIHQRRIAHITPTASTAAPQTTPTPSSSALALDVKISLCTLVTWGALRDDRADELETLQNRSRVVRNERAVRARRRRSTGPCRSKAGLAQETSVRHLRVKEGYILIGGGAGVVYGTGIRGVESWCRVSTRDLGPLQQGLATS
ncbi:hypothetical protein B0H14DRAFT_2616447 [Mycena olivaceomarginata]|nr:hypothetical protein B0H14DRAFT_2616447 [Mycena olivaceomarginata]